MHTVLTQVFEHCFTVVPKITQRWSASVTAHSNALDLARSRLIRKRSWR